MSIFEGETRLGDNSSDNTVLSSMLSRKDKTAQEDKVDIAAPVHRRPWHKKTLWIIVFLLILWPLGLVLSWKSTWPKPVKILVSVLIIAAFVNAVFIRLTSHL